MMHRKRTNLLPPLLAVLLCVAGGDVPARAQEPVLDMEGPLVDWTNHYRQMYGRTTLKLDPKLTEAARKYAWKMAALDKAGVGLDGKTVPQRAKEAGYANHVVGENLAFYTGQENPAGKLFECWMCSPPHWKRFQAKEATEIGLGVFRSKTGKYYACVILGSHSTPAPVLTVPPAYPAPQPGHGGPKVPTYYPNPATKEGFQFGIGSLPVTPPLPENYYTPPSSPYYGW